MLSIYSGFASIDHPRGRLRRLLSKQRYDPSNAARVRYAATFGVGELASARILVEDLAEIDLADLYLVPWERYKLVGYNSLWLSRVDGRPLGPREVDGLETAVKNDLRFDFPEDEIALAFSRSAHYLKAEVAYTADTGTFTLHAWRILGAKRNREAQAKRKP
jgi:hypothetical protein